MDYGKNVRRLPFASTELLKLIVVESFLPKDFRDGTQVVIGFRSVSCTNSGIRAADGTEHAHGGAFGVSLEWLYDYRVRQPHRQNDEIWRDMKSDELALLNPPADSLFAVIRDNVTKTISLVPVLEEAEFDMWIANFLGTESKLKFKHNCHCGVWDDVYSGLFLFPTADAIRSFIDGN